MADIAGIRYLQLLCFRRREETESVTADVDIGNRLLDLRHVAGDTFVSAAGNLVICAVRWRRREGHSVNGVHDTPGRLHSPAG